MIRNLLFFILLTHCLFAERGIVVSTNDRYANRYLIASLHHLREVLHCTLPIEIWHDGDELSSGVKEELSKISDVTFCDFETTFDGVFGSLRGWHSKPFMLLGSQFTDICLMDADVYFFQDPEILFEHEKYLASGTFFFRDRWNDFPQRGPAFTLREFLDKRNMYRTFIPSPSQYVPRSLLHIWTVDREPTFDNPLPIDCQEAGCVFINKTKHATGISSIVSLAIDRGVNKVYDILFGDKETYWLGLELVKERYAFNSGLPCAVMSDSNINIMIHMVNNQLFFQQKHPIPLGKKAYFEGRDEFTGKRWSREATKQEKFILNQLYKSYIKWKANS